MANNKAHGDYWDKAVSANDLKDNGGTVLMGGNIAADGAITNAPDMTITGAGRKPNPAPTQSATANIGTTKVNDSGTFAKLKAGEYVVKGGGVTTELAGVAYTGLQSGANNVQTKSIKTLLTRSTVLIDSWNYATGEATFNIGNPSSDDFDINSSYAAPTRAVPGNLVYMVTGAVPETDAYSEKTGG